MTDNKLKILIYSPVHGRANIVKEFVQKWKQLDSDKYYIGIVLSLDLAIDYDVLRSDYDTKLEIHEIGLTLAQKKNQAIERLLNFYHFDYLLELDSTGIISPTYFDKMERYLKERQPFFGTNRIAFHEQETNRILDYTIKNGGVWVSGRFIRRDIIQKTWNKYGYLWNPELNSGLGVNQENNIFNATGHRVRIVHTDNPYVYDLKTGNDVTPFDTLAKHPGEAVEVTDEEQKENILKQFDL
jgi:hypothetical protein